MDEKKRQRLREGGAPGGAGIFDDGGTGGSVDVAHGPYRESLPVGEMTVAEVRRRFQDQLDIHPEAVALLDGHEVDDATRLRNGQMLMFVRPAGEKGAQLPLLSPRDRAAAAKETGKSKWAPVITIEGSRAVMTSQEGKRVGVTVSSLVERLRERGPDTQDAILPDGVKAVRELPAGLVVVHQTPPSRYAFRWIAKDSEVPYGPGTEYRTVHLALPYIVTLAVFEGRGVPQLSGRNECFFLNESVDRRGLEAPLCYPALLNCSKFPRGEEHALSWICTQHLAASEFAGRETLHASIRDGLGALLRHLLESAFNYSSEHHELNSWFSETVAAGVDPRIASVEDWEKASAEDPLFALDVPWLPTGHTLGSAIERIRKLGARPEVKGARDLARLIANTAGRPKARPFPELPF